MNIIKKQGPMFIIDESKLESKYNTTSIKNGLYAAIYDEFLGAINNPKYKNLTSLEKFNKVNEFANNWLKDRNI